MKTFSASPLFPGGNSGPRFNSAGVPAFSLAESSHVDSHAHSGAGSCLNPKDRAGHEWVCPASGLADQELT